MNKIEIFVPAKFTTAPLDTAELETKTNKRWQYASFGRVSLFHILKNLSLQRILVPVYICASILEPLKKLGMIPVFYDLDKRDLNASLESIEYLSEKYNIKVVLVASMYGNAADLVEIERYCKEREIFLIDDSAQSFGAILEGRMVGTFGNAGFFSFSPGKPTAGHMGSLFWSDKNITIKRSASCLFHYLKWKDFQLNRLYRYERKRYATFINYVIRMYSRVYDSYNDDICKFEYEILGGIVKDLFEGKFDFRKVYQEAFYNRFGTNNYFRVVRHLRGEPSPHKLVMLFHCRIQAENFQNYLFDNKIFSMKGYQMLSNDFTYLPNAKEVEGKIVELPIEDECEKMNYLFKKVEAFVYNH